MIIKGSDTIIESPLKIHNLLNTFVHIHVYIISKVHYYASAPAYFLCNYWKIEIHAHAYECLFNFLEYVPSFSNCSGIKWQAIKWSWIMYLCLPCSLKSSLQPLHINHRNNDEEWITLDRIFFYPNHLRECVLHPRFKRTDRRLLRAWFTD